MRWLAVLLLLCAGCLQPPNPAGPNVPSPATGAVSVQEFGEALARWVEMGQVDTSDEFYKLAAESSKLGLTINVGSIPDNKRLTDSDKRDLAAKARSWR